jgi:hypothetical protein
VINRLILLVAKRTSSRLLKAVPPPAVSHPDPSMKGKTKKKKNFTFGGVEAFQSSLAPCKVDMPKKKDLYADDAE